MMYPYMTLGDGTEIVHSHIIDQDGVKKVIVHFERAIPDGFEDARCELPTYHWTERKAKIATNFSIMLLHILRMRISSATKNCKT